MAGDLSTGTDRWPEDLVARPAPLPAHEWHAAELAATRELGRSRPHGRRARLRQWLRSRIR